MGAVALAGHDLDTAIPSARMEAGLRDLNKDINFDVAVRKDEYGYALQMEPAKRRALEQNRIPVCHLDRYICSMDRGVAPEFKLWSVVSRPLEVEWWEADKENASIQYETIPFTDPKYADLYSDAEKGKDNGLVIMADGRLAKMKCFVYRKCRGRVVQVGWRFTFHNLINANIPGVTARTVNEKFNVDMDKMPVGSREELYAALVEE